MKIYNSSMLLLLPAVVILLVALLLLPFREPELGYFSLEWLTRSSVITGVVVVACSPVMFIPTGVVYTDRLRFNLGRGPGPWHVLGAGDRFVISRNAVHLQRADGTLHKTGLARWAVARRNWRKIERWYPTIDLPEAS